ncbi:MAG TPA: DUF6266 family protein [Daejeonella sp.]|uniref:DUF6266 family protein n=1 Tax=Daejeonella sp. TaxID=2805397 RepID=UPI002ED8CD7A
MGTIRKGALGGFSGKAGSIIGSSWRDINYIKGLPKLSNKPKSTKQLEQQAKFATAIRFLLPVKSLMNLTYGQVKTGRATGFNMALKQVLDEAITGTYPDYEIDFPKAMLAKGQLGTATDVALLVEDLNLTVSWSPRFDKLNRFITDEMTVLVFDPVSRDFVIGPEEVLRTAGTTVVEIPPEWAGSTVHVYMFYIGLNGKDVSNSIYAGTVGPI